MTFLKSASLYREPRVLSILFLGFSSGLPFLLTLATLQVWLKELGFSKTTLGLFALTTIPYSLKFVWAPLLEYIKIPKLSEIFGPRKSWMLISQIALIVSIITLGQSDPSQGLLWTALAALGVSFFSATQDIVIEAYRIQLLDSHEVGAGAGASNLGYRLGMWVSGAGALYLASHFDWAVVYTMMAACMTLGIVTTLLIPEASTPLDADRPDDLKVVPFKKGTPFLRRFDKAIFEIRYCFKDSYNFLKAEKAWMVILGFIIFYKLIDTSLNVMMTPFLLEIGFSKVEIAHVGKSFGISAMIAGGLFAGILLATRPLFQILFLCIVLQGTSALFFTLQSLIGDNLVLLFATVGIEHFSSGMGAAAFITYLSHIACHRNAATHFAFLTSMASLVRVVISYLSGAAADHFEWNLYFTGVGIATLLFAGFLGFHKRHFEDVEGKKWAIQDEAQVA